jgi:hypothetical protein
VLEANVRARVHILEQVFLRSDVDAAQVREIAFRDLDG